MTHFEERLSQRFGSLRMKSRHINQVKNGIKKHKFEMIHKAKNGRETYLVEWKETVMRWVYDRDNDVLITVLQPGLRRLTQVYSHKRESQRKKKLIKYER